MESILVAIFTAILTLAGSIFAFTYQKRHERKEKDYEKIFIRISKINNICFKHRSKLNYEGTPHDAYFYASGIDELSFEISELATEIFIMSVRIHRDTTETLLEFVQSFPKKTIRPLNETFFKNFQEYSNETTGKIRTTMLEDMKFKNTVTNNNVKSWKDIKKDAKENLKSKLRSRIYYL